MRIPKQCVCDALTASSGLAALIGDRIYHERPPETPVWPLITYKQVAGTADKADGINYMGRARIEIKAWGDEGLEDIADEILAAMNTCRGGPVLVFETELLDGVTLKRIHIMDFNLIVKL